MNESKPSSLYRECTTNVCFYYLQNSGTTFGSFFYLLNILSLNAIIDSISTSQKSNGWRIFSLINRSILPFEIYSKWQCHNFADVSLSHRLRLFFPFIDEEDSLLHAIFLSLHTTFTFPCIDNI